MGVYDPKKPRVINSVSVTLALVAVVMVYLGYVLIPPYWQIFQLQGILKAACNEAYSEWDDDKVVDFVLKEVPRTGLPLNENNIRFTRVPYTPEGLQEEFGERASTQNVQRLAERRGALCRLEYRYARKVNFPIIDQEVPLVHQGKVEGSLKTVRYDTFDNPFNCRCVGRP